MNFDIYKDGQRFGPHTLEELKALFDRGRVDAKDTVIRESGEELSVGALLGVPTRAPFKPITSAPWGKSEPAAEPAGNLIWAALFMAAVHLWYSYKYAKFQGGGDSDEYMGEAVGGTLGIVFGVTLATFAVRLVTKKPGVARRLCSFLVVGYAVNLLIMAWQMKH